MIFASSLSGYRASPFDQEAYEAVVAHNMKGALEGIPCFYCRGAWNEDEMTFKDRTLCRMLQKAVAKKNPKDYELTDFYKNGINCYLMMKRRG